MMKKTFLLAAAVVFQVEAARSNAAVVSVAGGTTAPASTLGSYTMTPFAADPSAVSDSSNPATFVTSVASPLTGRLTFSEAVDHATIDNGWISWSNGYTGDVYATYASTAKADLTLAMPANTGAFYFYVAPSNLNRAGFNMTVTDQNGAATTLTAVQGLNGARYFGLYGTDGTTITSVSIHSADASGLGVGEFGIAAAVPEPASIAALALGAGWMLRRRRV